MAQPPELHCNGCRERPAPSPRPRGQVGTTGESPARPGEVVNPGQPVVTLINPDDLWVRADIEETYIDRVRIGDELTVRLPSGEERKGISYFLRMAAEVARTRADVRFLVVGDGPHDVDRGRKSATGKGDGQA